jgi:hypothetical protein
MCIYDIITSDCDYSVSSDSWDPAHNLGQCEQPPRGAIKCGYIDTTYYTSFTSPEPAPMMPSARQQVLSSTDQPFEENLVDMQRPPPHVVDYWFDKLGLSLDPTSSEGSSNSTAISSELSLIDAIDYVSSPLLTLCCSTPCWRVGACVNDS